jgi:hypothetical protein
MHAAALVQPSMKSFRAALIGCMASQWLLISNNAGLGGVSDEFPLAGVSGCFRGCPGLSVDRVGTKKYHLH